MSRHSHVNFSPPVQEAENKVWRAVDLAIVVLVLPVGLLVAVVVAIIIALWDGWPVLYRAVRVGQYGKPFVMYKFRTMCPNAESIVWNNPSLRTTYEEKFKLLSDPRVTRVGKNLRKYSLDEIPQLFNVLKGEMSIVGPRPISFAELARYGEHAKQVFVVRPGMTGLWQVSGRNDVDYDVRIRLDMQYAHLKSLRLDGRILINTIRVVLSGMGR